MNLYYQRPLTPCAHMVHIDNALGVSAKVIFGIF